MVVKKKSSKKDKRPIVKLMCTECQKHTYNTRKNPTNTPDRIQLKKFCPVDRKTTLFKETK